MTMQCSYRIRLEGLYPGCTMSSLLFFNQCPRRRDSRAISPLISTLRTSTSTNASSAPSLCVPVKGTPAFIQCCFPFCPGVRSLGSSPPGIVNSPFGIRGRSTHQSYKKDGLHKFEVSSPNSCYTSSATTSMNHQRVVKGQEHRSSEDR